MRQRTYLNSILTINAVLLTGLLWMQVVNGPSMTSSAHASAPSAQSRSASGIPNAGEQRNEIIRQLRALNEKVEKSNKALTGGDMRVHVINVSELRAAVNADRD